MLKDRDRYICIFDIYIEDRHIYIYIFIWDLDSLILMGPFQLKIFYDSMI